VDQNGESLVFENAGKSSKKGFVFEKLYGLSIKAKDFERRFSSNNE
jgi:hypothetical protein